AKKNKVSILAGSLYEKIQSSKKVYNTSVLIGSDGKVSAKYRKINLFDANVDGKRIRESKHFAAGTKTALANVHGIKVGLSICFDLRYPELYRKYSLEGAEILCVPSAFTMTTGKAHWEMLLRARAIENKCFVLAPNQTGENSQGVLCYGNSMIVDPWGQILARASNNKEEIIYADINKEKVLQVKTILGRK
ncbi:MAG: carbon-nitrogen hydrolase family protein, partial [Candidatus Omnitrophica bacterium]|nr:carbon-nitrogen hydrolase family protein [Candidatus Omnitrophota bacterium]